MVTLNDNDNSYTDDDSATNIDAKDGDDTVSGAGGADTILGGRGDDDLFGDAGDDEIEGGRGNDSIEGGTGDDKIDGEEDNDTIRGGANDDKIFGGSGADKLYGDGGKDTIEGDDGSDSIEGGDNDDELFGEEGNDTIKGGGGDDLIRGGDNSDTLEGEVGNDTIEGDDGDDVISGGANNDKLSGEAGNDSILGGDNDDTIYGNDNRDTLKGEDGHDDIFGGSGDDSIEGGEGNDSIEGDDGDDKLYGGAGDDTIKGGLKEDTIRGGDGVDSITGGSQQDVIYVNDDVGPDWVNGEGEDDWIYGGAGDTLIGGPGDDNIFLYLKDEGQAPSLVEGRGDKNDIIVYLYDAHTGEHTLRGGNSTDPPGLYEPQLEEDSVTYRTATDEGVAPVRSFSRDGDRRVVAADADLEFDWEGYFDNGQKMLAEFDSSGFESNNLSKAGLSGTVIGDSSIDLNSAVNRAPVASEYVVTVYEGEIATGNLLDAVTDDDDFTGLTSLSAYAQEFAVGANGVSGEIFSDGRISFQTPITASNDASGSTSYGYLYYVTDGIEVSFNQIRIISLQNDAPVAEDLTRVVDVDATPSTEIDLLSLISNTETDQKLDVVELRIYDGPNDEVSVFNVASVASNDGLLDDFIGGSFRKNALTNELKLTFTDTSEPYRIDYVASDGILTDVGTLTIEFNDAPEAADATVVVGTNTPVRPADFASDPNGDAVSLVSITVPTSASQSETFAVPTTGAVGGYSDLIGIFSFDATGLLTFQGFSADFLNSGTADITYTVTDGRLEESGVITLDRNDPPETSNINTTVLAGTTSFNLDILASVTDPDGQDLSVVSIDLMSAAGDLEHTFINSGTNTPVSGPTGLRVTFENDGTVTFSDPGGLLEDLNLVYSVTDGILEEEAELFIDANYAPDVDDGSATVALGTRAINVDLVGTLASDLDGDALEVTAVRAIGSDGVTVEEVFDFTNPNSPFPDGIHAVREADGTVTFFDQTLIIDNLQTIYPGFTEDQIFEFDVTDGLSTTTARFTVDINTPPEAIDGSQTVFSGMRSVNVDLAGTLASDADGDALEVIAVRLMASDGVTVEEVFDFTNPNGPLPDGIHVVREANGTVTFSDETLIIDNLQTIYPGFTEDQIFEFDVTDGLSVATARFALDVRGLPVANDDVLDPLFATVDETFDISTAAVLANDTFAEGYPLTVVQAITTSARGATVTMTASNIAWDGASSLELQQLAALETVSDSFSYTIRDTTDLVDSAEVSFQVVGVNDDPTLDPFSVPATTNRETVFEIDLRPFGDDIDSDDDGDSLKYEIETAPGKGSATIVDGVLSYDPTGAFQGLGLADTEAVTLVISATDRHGASTTQSYTIEVSGTDTSPTVDTADPPPFTESDTSDIVTIKVSDLVSASDPDPLDVPAVDPSTIVVTADPVSDVTSISPILIDATTGEISFDRAAFNGLQAGQSAVYTVGFAVNSGTAVVPDAFTLTINGENDAPTAISLSNASVEEGSTGVAIGDLATTDVDVGDTHSYEITEVRDDGGVIVPSPFEIVDGTLKLKDGLALDYDDATGYAVTISSTDQGGLGASISKTFQIAVDELPGDAGWHDGFTFIGVNDWYNPAWGGGFNATFSYTLQEDDVIDGEVMAWDILPRYSGPGTITTAWTNGYNAPVSIEHDNGDVTLTTVGESYQLTLQPGDTINFSIQVNGAPYSADDFAFAFSDEDQPQSQPGPIDPAQNVEIIVEELASWSTGKVVEFYLRNLSNDPISDIDDLVFSFDEPGVSIRESWGVDLVGSDLDVVPWSPQYPRPDLLPGDITKIGGMVLDHDRDTQPEITEADFSIA